jgi:hypothetical protein
MTLSNVAVDDYFLAPAISLLCDYTRAGREQSEGLTDERFVRLGLIRALEGDESGRAFLQSLSDRGDEDAVARTTWFDAFQSQRRLSLITEMATVSYRHFERELGGRDWLEEFPELRNLPVWAVDGHQIEHACHARRDAAGQHVSCGLTYGLCLHSGLVRPLAQFQGDGVRRHEWPVFKERWRRWLTGERRPGMPIVVVDPAYIDTQYWIMQKIQRQAMVITREKENMKPIIYGPNAFDTADPVNAGVLADDYAGYSNAALRRIHYRDPATGKELVFVTTCHSLRPGLIALLYFLRWKIEKVYDVFKNKLKVRKAWGGGEISALTQAHFVALLHNLLTVLLARMEQIGIPEQKLEDRAQRQLSDPRTRVTPSHQMIHHAFQLTCQFIRLVRHCLRYKMPWNRALPLFQQRLSVYL